MAESAGPACASVLREVTSLVDEGLQRNATAVKQLFNAEQVRRDILYRALVPKLINGRSSQSDEDLFSLGRSIHLSLSYQNTMSSCLTQPRHALTLSSTVLQLSVDGDFLYLLADAAAIAVMLQSQTFSDSQRSVKQPPS